MTKKKTGSQEGKTGQGNQEKQRHPERGRRRLKNEWFFVSGNTLQERAENQDQERQRMRRRRRRTEAVQAL